MPNSMTRTILLKMCLLPSNYCCTLHDIANNTGVCTETVQALVMTKKIRKKAQPQTVSNQL